MPGHRQNQEEDALLVQLRRPQEVSRRSSEILPGASNDVTDADAISAAPMEPKRSYFCVINCGLALLARVALMGSFIQYTNCSNGPALFQIACKNK